MGTGLQILLLILTVYFIHPCIENILYFFLDEGNQQVLDFQREATEHYRETLENLEKVNNTVNFVMQMINDTRSTVESKLNWILELIGTSGKYYVSR